jgi:hypothetical protein
MKSNQFCSVCKEWLDMEVVPTSDGEEDDGVIWFRCPQCKGFLPKLSGTDTGTDKAAAEEVSGPKEGETPGPEDPTPAEPDADADGEALPWDSPADMMAARDKGEPDALVPDPEDGDLLPDEAGDRSGPGKDDASGPTDKDDKKEAEPAEPIHEYKALLEAQNQIDPAPYRPWETYEVGQCILHQAWEDCGVVVAKETLPGGREVIKCYFGEAGVVRLIEKAPR